VQSWAAILAAYTIIVLGLKSIRIPLDLSLSSLLNAVRNRKREHDSGQRTNSGQLVIKYLKPLASQI
jgi:hypothetical protein